MALVIETGTGSDAGANSFVSDAEFVTWAATRNITLPATQAEREALLLNAMDYLETLDGRFVGSRMTSTQPLSWPRYGGYSRGFMIDDGTIPPEVKTAQMLLAVESMKTDLIPTLLPGAKGPVVMQRVEGAVAVQYAPPSPDAPNRPVFTRVDAMLRPLLASRRLQATR